MFSASPSRLTSDRLFGPATRWGRRLRTGDGAPMPACAEMDVRREPETHHSSEHADHQADAPEPNWRESEGLKVERITASARGRYRGWIRDASVARKHYVAARPYRAMCGGCPP